MAANGVIHSMVSPPGEVACCWLLAAISLESRRGESAWRDGMYCRHHGWRGGTSRQLPQMTPPCGMTRMLQLMLPRQQPWLSQPPAKQATPCGSRKGGNTSQLPLRILAWACAKLPTTPAWCSLSSRAPTTTQRWCSMAGTMKPSPSTLIECSAWTVDIPHGFVPWGWWLTLMSPGLVLLQTLCYMKRVALLRLNAHSLAETNHLRMLPGERGILLGEVWGFVAPAPLAPLQCTASSAAVCHPGQVLPFCCVVTKRNPCPADWAWQCLHLLCYW